MKKEEREFEKEIGVFYKEKHTKILKSILLLFFFTLLAVGYTLFVYWFAAASSDIKVNNQPAQPAIKHNVNVSASVPVNPCNSCIAECQTKECRVECYNNFCK